MKRAFAFIFRNTDVNGGSWDIILLCYSTIQGADWSGCGVPILFLIANKHGAPDRTSYCDRPCYVVRQFRHQHFFQYLVVTGN